MRLLPVLAALCLTACGSAVREETAPATTTTTTTTTTITGTVSVAPNCPLTSPPRPCPPQPAPAAEVEVRDGTVRDAGTVVATAKTGADGRFTVTVDAGRYVLAARLTGPPATTCSSVPVTVPPPATADITCAPTSAP